uniref:Chromosome 11 open reading frame 97 n=1 Tax=Amazona collaria TaxID=241587 RepID=A0A8B9FHE2_9PSIT
WSWTARAAVVTGPPGFSLPGRGGGHEGGDQGAAGGGGGRGGGNLYVEPSRRVKELLEEELYIQKEACCVKHPVAEALEGIWNVKKNFSIGSLNSVQQSRNSLLLQPQFYSRHTGMKSKSQQ